MKVRSIFLSDIHLGTRGCQADRLLDFLREFESDHLFLFGDILIAFEWQHVTADGKRLLLTHGDQFDQVTRHHRWVAVLGDKAYDVLVGLNGWLSWWRRTLRIGGYWSLAGYAKRKVKSAVTFIFDFEDSVIRSVRDRGLNGVVCGHIHSAAIKEVDELLYVNCGDWVDSCTAVVEHLDGRLELIEWRNSAKPSPEYAV